MTAFLEMRGPDMSLRAASTRQDEESLATRLGIIANRVLNLVPCQGRAAGQALRAAETLTMGAVGAVSKTPEEARENTASPPKRCGQLALRCRGEALGLPVGVALGGRLAGEIATRQEPHSRDVPRRLTEIRLGGACLSVDLQQVGGDQLPVGRLSLVGKILPTGYRTTTCI
jgi:hypothetical protein